MWFYICVFLIILFGFYLTIDYVVLIKLVNKAPEVLSCLIIFLNCSPIPCLKEGVVYLRKKMLDDDDRVRCSVAVESNLKARIFASFVVCLFLYGILCYLSWNTMTHEMMCSSLDSHGSSHVTFSNSHLELPLYALCFLFRPDEPYIIVLKNHSAFDDTSVQSNFSYNPSTNMFTIGEQFINISTFTLNYGCMWYTFTWNCHIDLPDIHRVRREEYILPPSHFSDEAREKKKVPGIVHFIIALTALLILSLFMCCIFLSFAIFCIFLLVISFTVIFTKLIVGM